MDKIEQLKQQKQYEAYVKKKTTTAQMCGST